MVYPQQDGCELYHGVHAGVPKCPIIFTLRPESGQTFSLRVLQGSSFNQIPKNLILESLSILEIPDLWREKTIRRSRGWYGHSCQRLEMMLGTKGGIPSKRKTLLTCHRRPGVVVKENHGRTVTG